MAGTYADAAEQAIAATTWPEAWYVERTAQAAATRMLRVFAALLDAAASGGEKEIPLDVRAEIDNEYADYVQRVEQVKALDTGQSTLTTTPPTRGATS